MKSTILAKIKVASASRIVLLVMMYLMGVFYLIPFVLHGGDVGALLKDGLPGMLAPITWVLGVFGVFWILAVIDCVTFHDRGAVRITSDRLIYLNYLWFSVDLKNIVRVETVERKYFGNSDEVVRVLTRSGRQKDIPTKPLDKEAEELAVSIRRACPN